MCEAQFAVDPWSREGDAAWEEFAARTRPSWLRKLSAENTDKYEQAAFEERAILKEARRLYHIRMGIKDA